MAGRGNPKTSRSQGGDEENPGNNQMGRQMGHNTGQDAWKSNVKLQTRNDPGAPRTAGPEKKEREREKGKSRK